MVEVDWEGLGARGSGSGSGSESGSGSGSGSVWVSGSRGMVGAWRRWTGRVWGLTTTPRRARTDTIIKGLGLGLSVSLGLGLGEWWGSCGGGLGGSGGSRRHHDGLGRTP